MSNFHTFDIDFNNYHLVFPYAIGTLLIVLLLAMVVKKLITQLAVKPTDSSDSSGWSGPDAEKSRFRFFDVDFDWKKLFGALGCTVAYILLLAPLGFLISSILFIFGISLVFKPSFTPRALIGPAANAILTPLVLWLVFGQMFDITLP
ncbi:tripartite tricarboxylate transporter TctB family protein [Brevibacterium marinum]|uniref:Small-conductance mechanosensitive channel n=1 Tax=Brevibacterium marinum TaxID=418643 RepID=A0A846RXK0_9MICO|nr:tripartite tricarboxylate transporter TctB family protein [Brevibacterium marinum]NJC55373.1 small-conductance mechanosensitive channel [Brevibacterium marinum]